MNGEKLLKLARKSIKTYFSKENFEIDEFDEKRGIFVTLYKDNKLRGCIGFIKAVDLNKGIIEAACELKKEGGALNTPPHINI